MDTPTLNIINVFLSASDADYHDGMTWYPRARDLALELCPDDALRGAGIIAAFSPNTLWHHNIVLARRFVASGGTMDRGTLSASIAKARAIYNGAPVLETLNGQKTVAFASAIAYPETSTVATIDRHAYNIAMATNIGDPKIGVRVFRYLSNCYVSAAEYAGISVAQMQAVTWVAHRNRKAVKKGD